MSTEQLAVVQGWADTRETLKRWNARPSIALRPWALASLGVAVLLLCATWVVAVLSTPDASGAGFPGVSRPAHLGDFGFVLFRNGLVLALHSLACVAGFMAGSSLPQVAEGYKGVWRKVHELAGPLAIAFVCGATLFSLATQAYALGGGGIYHRLVQITTPSVGYTTFCDPYWYVCYPTLVSVDTIIGDRSSNDFGINFGGGLTFGREAKFYIESRIHYVWGRKIEPATAGNLPATTATGSTCSSGCTTNATYYPLTFGVRW